MANEGTKDYRIARVYYRTLEPVHAGAGGYRLGRVDNTICREPGTDLPKIPGTSLAGAARAYAALAYGKPEAAGQHKHWTGKDRKKCPILFTFGTANDDDSGQAGKVSFGDAQLLFVPVATMRGPVWVTTAGLLQRYCGVTVAEVTDVETIRAAKGITEGHLNLGWLLFSKVEELEAVALGGFPEVTPRLVVVHPSLFPQVVNSNLEVRTSVSISPETGAAEKGALFTYEAIPRDTYLVQEVVEDCFADSTGILPVKKKYRASQERDENNRRRAGDEQEGAEITGWDTPLDIAIAGLRMINPLGVGGMGTRGFGRMELLVWKDVS